jgi:glucosylceramidase
MNSKVASAILFSLSALITLSAHAQKDVSLWLTNSDRSALFQLQTPPIPSTNTPATNQIIDVDSKKTYQTMDGFGFAPHRRQRAANHAYGPRKTRGSPS